jgi:hypothetical protein
MSMLCLISPPSHWGPRDHQRSSWQWCHYCLICWQWSRCCLLCWQWCQCCLLFWQCWQCCLLCWQWSHLHHIKDPKIVRDPLGNDVHVVAHKGHVALALVRPRASHIDLLVLNDYKRVIKKRLHKQVLPNTSLQ